MNSYAVAYTPDADDSLALAWLSATDRQAVAASQNQIDQFLAIPWEEADRQLTQEQHQVTGAGVFFEGIKE